MRSATDKDRDKQTLSDARQRVQDGVAHDPFEVLGLHPTADGGREITVFLPPAEAVQIDGLGELQRIPGSDCFVLQLQPADSPAQHYSLTWTEKRNGNVHHQVSPYTFLPQISDFDLHLFQEGHHQHAWTFLGARPVCIDEVAGVQFAVWAPAVKRVSVVGDFNEWDGRRHPMRCRGYVRNLGTVYPGSAGGRCLQIRNDLGAMASLVTKDRSLCTADVLCGPRPPAVPRTSTCILGGRRLDRGPRPLRLAAPPDQHLRTARRFLAHGMPMADFYTWAELAEQLIPYVSDLGYTHIELMPVSRTSARCVVGLSGVPAISRRRRASARRTTSAPFVDACHQARVSVCCSTGCPAHFPKDDFALARFTGEPVYEHADPRRGEHQDWGTLIFDFGRNEVRNFLVANALYWLDEFHIDGLRVDAVASMLYLDYSRKPGEWLPNQYGGRENIEAIHFLREMNTEVHGRFPGVLTIAEESTAWPAVSRPVELGGLGFSMKWNMGWMNDSLDYIEKEPVYPQVSAQPAHLQPDVCVDRELRAAACRMTKSCT